MRISCYFFTIDLTKAATHDIPGSPPGLKTFCPAQPIHLLIFTNKKRGPTYTRGLQFSGQLSIFLSFYAFISDMFSMFWIIVHYSYYVNRFCYKK